MTLVQSWIDSLTLLKPKNFQLFVMVTLKSIVEAYKLLLRFFWWVVPAFILFVVALFFTLTYLYPSYYGSLRPTPDLTLAWFYMPVGFYVIYQLLFLAVCFITRPSIAQKDWGYLLTQYRKIILYWIIIALLTLYSDFRFSYSIWSVFLVLFFIDSEGGPKNFFFSMWYALKMIIFNAPLLAIMGICFYVLGYFFSLLMTKAVVVSTFDERVMADALIIMGLGRTAIKILLLPIGVCTYANVYIKKVHDQFDLYFKQQS
jgi:hypothetical protein